MQEFIKQMKEVNLSNEQTSQEKNNKQENKHILDRFKTKKKN